MKKTKFGTLGNESVYRYDLTNEKGYKVSVMNYGATLLAYEIPDKNGDFKNVVVSTPRFEEYINNSPRWSATIGPVAGRIANATFTLGDVVYTLEKNNGNHHLHGGSNGYEQVLFDVDSSDDTTVTFITHQKDMAQGYPGNIVFKVTYTLLENGELIIAYTVTTDKDTLMNPTNHSYFNLSGDVTKPIDEQVVTLKSTGYTVLDDDNIPTGEINCTDAFFKKLTKGVPLKDVFEDTHEQIATRNGIDHAFVLEQTTEQITVFDAMSGRQLHVTTQSPAVVLYTANGFDDVTFINGQKPVVHNGIAIETQVLPDAIHHSGFGNIVLKANETFTTQTHYIPSVVIKK
ncbi:galactose mutarotase [Carnobacteriaceae bacterium zg-ZUI252]|nr:galactose mutarotase [Carnobacteriaceae bacterium zg-ZUI252]